MAARGRPLPMSHAGRSPMKELESLDAAFVIDTFLLLLIGIGPKIALVPFLDATAAMPEATKRGVLRKMLTTAAIVAALLLVLGRPADQAAALLAGLAGRRERHHPADHRGHHGPRPAEWRRRRSPGRRPGSDAGGRLPAGCALPAQSGRDRRPGHLVGRGQLHRVLAVGVGVLIAVLVLDVVVFRWAVQVSSKLDASRMLVTEKVFGFLLAAPGQVLRGLLFRRSMRCVQPVRRNPYPQVMVPPDVQYWHLSPVSSDQSVRKL
jgi:hypothetical protein